MLSILLWSPLAFGVVGLALPRRLTGWWGGLGCLVTLRLAIWLVADFDSAAGGLQHSVDTEWISGRGVSYSLAVDGISLFLVLLTGVLWLPATAYAASREQERPQLFFLMMLLAETATLG